MIACLFLELCFLTSILIYIFCLLVKERGNESTKGQTAKREVHKAEKESQKAGKGSMYIHKSHLSSYSHHQVWGKAKKGYLFLCADKDVPISSVFWNRPCSYAYANGSWKGVFKSQLNRRVTVIYLTPPPQQFWPKNNFQDFAGIEIWFPFMWYTVYHKTKIIRSMVLSIWELKNEKKKCLYSSLLLYLQKRHHITTVYRRWPQHL